MRFAPLFVIDCLTSGGVLRVGSAPDAFWAPLHQRICAITRFQAQFKSIFRLPSASTAHLRLCREGSDRVGKGYPTVSKPLINSYCRIVRILNNLLVKSARLFRAFDSFSPTTHGPSKLPPR